MDDAERRGRAYLTTFAVISGSTMALMFWLQVPGVVAFVAALALTAGGIIGALGLK